MIKFNCIQNLLKLIMDTPTTSKKKLPISSCKFRYCKLDSSKYFDFETQYLINDKYWNMTIDQQNQFLFDNILVKNDELNYFFRLNLSENKQICRRFFLNTLGYKYDHKIRYLFKNLKNQNSPLNVPKN